MRLNRTQGVPQHLRSAFYTLGCVWQRGVTKSSNISFKRNNSKILCRFMPKLSVGTILWNKRTLVSPAWACAAFGCKIVFFPAVFYSGMFPTDVSTVKLWSNAVILSIGKAWRQYWCNFHLWPKTRLTCVQFEDRAACTEPNRKICFRGNVFAKG